MLRKVQEYTIAIFMQDKELEIEPEKGMATIQEIVGYQRLFSWSSV